MPAVIEYPIDEDGPAGFVVKSFMLSYWSVLPMVMLNHRFSFKSPSPPKCYQ